MCAAEVKASDSLLILVVETKSVCVCAAEVKASDSLLILVVETKSVCVCASEVKASDSLLQTFQTSKCHLLFGFHSNRPSTPVPTRGWCRLRKWRQYR